MLINSGREIFTDKKFTNDSSGMVMVNKLFIRPVALKKKFINTNFKYCIFDAAYFRNCSFENCDFTGCRFINCNLVGTDFSGCIFDYSTFDKSYIDNDILKKCCPDRENLKLKFARSLRLNYQQIGDAVSVNRAINVELSATKEHHKKSWSSNDRYYRNKYRGFRRLSAFFSWLEFQALDLIWGNGESLFKLCRSVFAILIILSLVDVFCSRDPELLTSYWDGLTEAPKIFFSIKKPSYLNEYGQMGVYLLRLVMFAFFMSIIIKRFNRR